MEIEELHEFYKNKVVNQAKEEVTAWFKRRTIIIAITITILGFIGINVLVFQAVREGMEQQLITTYKELGKVTAQSGEYSKELEEAKKLLKEYETEIVILRKGASDIGNQFNEIHESLEAKNRRSLKQFQITSMALEQTIKDFAEALNALSVSINVSDEMKSKINDINTTLRDLNNIVSSFNENRKYLIEIIVSNEQGANFSDKLIDSLSSEGYEVRFYSGVTKHDLANSYRINESDINSNLASVIFEVGGEKAAKDALKYLSTHLSTSGIKLLPSPRKSKSGQVTIGVVL